MGRKPTPARRQRWRRMINAFEFPSLTIRDFCQQHDVSTVSFYLYINANLWAYSGSRIPLNLFGFAVSRHRDGPDLILIDSECQGILLGDAYGANTGIIIRSEAAAIWQQMREYIDTRTLDRVPKDSMSEAIILLVISSAARNDIEIGAHFEQLLRALLAGRTDYEAFRPDVWAAAHRDKLRKHRLLEREFRARRKGETRSHCRLIKSH